MPRSRLGPLALETKLGDYPSQSLVWRAIHIELHRAIAVKVFSVPFGGTPEGRQRFAEEWETLKRLQHPAIARCYGGGFEESDAYLAYELIEGESVAHQLERRTRLQWDSVLEIGITLTDALIFAHRLGVCHGAIGPDKVIISGLSAVLVDFRVDRAESIYRSMRPPTPAELALQAPEVIVDPKSVSPRSDIYSLGALMFLALTGRPPISGNSVQEVRAGAPVEQPPKPASFVLDGPVWGSTIIQQMLAKRPDDRPRDATALSLALAEAQRRSAGRAGVAEHVSSGFSPLQMTPQKDKDEARLLLGRELLEESQKSLEPTPLFERVWFLVSLLVAIVIFVAWLVWPLGELEMRARAENLIAQQTRSSLEQAKKSYLIPMLKRFPEGSQAQWASDQLDQIRMIEAEHALSVKLKRNLPLRDEGERLYAEAQRFEQFGDRATALDKYKSMETLLAGDPQYKPFVDLARRQISEIRSSHRDVGEAARMVQTKLAEADALFDAGQVVAARDIWYSVVELYRDNADLAPLVQTAQQRLGTPTSTGIGQASPQP